MALVQIAIVEWFLDRIWHCCKQNPVFVISHLYARRRHVYASVALFNQPHRLWAISQWWRCQLIAPSAPTQVHSWCISGAYLAACSCWNFTMIEFKIESTIRPSRWWIVMRHPRRIKFRTVMRDEIDQLGCKLQFLLHMLYISLA